MSIRDIGAVLSASELAWWYKGFRHSSHRRSSIETAIAALKWKRTLVFARLTRTYAPLKSGGIHRKGSLSWTTNLHKTVYIVLKMDIFLSENEVCSGALLVRCYFEELKIDSAIDPLKPSLKSMAQYFFCYLMSAFVENVPLGGSTMRVHFA